jgi:2-C-methyl-D-erythritol 4-phosphate cytidylyltransferase
MATFSVILPAAGKSTRFGDQEKKPFVSLDGRAIWLRAAELFVTRKEVVQCLIVIAPEDMDKFLARYKPNLIFLNITAVLGGSERFASVANALEKLDSEAQFVAIHDAVRPCTSHTIIDQVFAAAVRHGAAIPAIPLTDTIKRTDENSIVRETFPREGLWAAQTPQVFRKDWLLEAYAKRNETTSKITDDSQLVEALGHEVHLVAGSPMNLKITTKDDLKIAEAVLHTPHPGSHQKPTRPFEDEEMWK